MSLTENSPNSDVVVIASKINVDIKCPSPIKYRVCNACDKNLGETKFGPQQWSEVGKIMCLSCIQKLFDDNISGKRTSTIEIGTTTPIMSPLSSEVRSAPYPPITTTPLPSKQLVADKVALNVNKKGGTNYSSPIPHCDENPIRLVTEGMNEGATTQTMTTSALSSTTTSTSTAKSTRHLPKTETVVEADTNILLVSFNHSKRFIPTFGKRMELSSESHNNRKMIDDNNKSVIACQVRDTIRHWYFVNEFEGKTECISSRELLFSPKRWKLVVKKISKSKATSMYFDYFNTPDVEYSEKFTSDVCVKLMGLCELDWKRLVLIFSSTILHVLFK